MIIVEFLDTSSLSISAQANHHFFNLVMDASVWKLLSLQQNKQLASEFSAFQITNWTPFMVQNWAQSGLSIIAPDLASELA
jgi:hypothetical protein